MKVRITLKDPDGVYDSIIDAVQQQLARGSYHDQEEKDQAGEYWQERITEETAPWIEYGEYVTIEIDLDSRTAEVLKP